MRPCCIRVLITQASHWGDRDGLLCGEVKQCRIDEGGNAHVAGLCGMWILPPKHFEILPKLKGTHDGQAQV
jgi:hypothetical protein